MKILKYIDFLNENAINDTPEQYIETLLKNIKSKIDGFFNKSNSGKEEGGMSLKDLNLQLISSEVSKYSKSYDNLKVIFSDDGARYDLIITVGLKEALPKDNEKDFSIDDIKECSVKFKKYNSQDFNLIGEINKTIKISNIDEEMLINLKLEFDKQFDQNSGEKLEIET